MSSDPATNPPTPPVAMREVDVDKINSIGFWIGKGHVHERVQLCIKLRHLFTGAEEQSKVLQTMLDPEVAKQALPLVEQVLAGMLAAIKGLENGAHINATQFPEHYRFVVAIADEDRVFALSPEEYAMATMALQWSPPPPK